MYKFEDLIEEVKEFNTDLRYGLDDIVGVTIEKGLIPTIANLTQTALDKFYIIKPETFVYNPRTHGVRLGMGYNDTCNTYITTWNNVAFRVKDTAKNIVIPQYLWLYFCRPVWDRLTNFLAWGSSTIVFAWKDFLTIEIDLPSITRQREIVAEYETLTRRIRINEQMIQNLESTAQTLYRKMFVDGIDKENLPEGWRMGTLGEICSKIGSGSTPKGGKDCYTNSGISLIRSMNVFDFRFSYDELAHISDIQAASLDSVTIEEKDILFNITGASVARCCMVPNNVLPARVNQHVMIIRPEKDFMSYYLLCTLCSDKAKRSLLGMSQSGSTREAITKSEIESFKIVIPATELLKNYDNQAEIIFAHIDIHKQENSKLIELQSLLLAKMGQ